MLLTKHRVPAVVAGFILLVVLALVTVLPASADPATDPFGDDNGDWGWRAQRSGQVIGIEVVLAEELEGKVSEIEVFLEPSGAETPPAITKRMGDPTKSFPAGTRIKFNFNAPEDAYQSVSDPQQRSDLREGMATPPEVVGVHLHGEIDRASDTADSAQDLTDLLPEPTPTPVRPTPTPVVTVSVPESDVTQVPAPSGGEAVIVQPDATSQITSADGTLTVSVPRTAHSKTFQLVYNPSPDEVPEGSARTLVLRAFELNAHGADGTQASLSLIRPITITVKYTAEDVAVAHGNNPSNLKILAYRPATSTWSPLSTSPDLGAQTLTANARHLSLFAVGSTEPAPQTVGSPTPTAELPVTGDIAPTPGLVMGLLVLGLLLVIGGSAYLVHTRRVKA